METSALDAVGGSSGTDQLCQYILQLLSQEYGNNGRRCLISSQTVVISHIFCRFPKQVCMYIDSLQDTGQYHQELNILMRCLARLQKINAIIRG